MESPSHSLPEQPNYFWHWVAIFVPMAVGFFILPWLTKTIIQERLKAQAKNGETNWYLILKMPEVPTTDPVVVKKAQEKFGGWMGAIRKAGYHPMLLSDVLKHRAEGIGLPDKTLVLVFEPGYRATYDALTSVLKEHGFPSVWLSRSDVKDRDFRFVSRHVINQMQDFGMWDFGLYRGSTNGFDLTKFGRDSSEDPITWSSGIYWRAKNSFQNGMCLNKLILKPEWTNEELLEQLDSEVPLQATSNLYIKQLNGRTEFLHTPLVDGIVTSPFDIGTDIHHRANTGFWPSTEDISNFDLDISFKSLTGELWLLLRSDEKLSNGIQIGFSKGVLNVNQVVAGVPKQLLMRHYDRTFENNTSVRISMEDDELSIRLAGEEPLKVILPNAVPFPQEKFGLMVSGHVRGFAQVSGMDVTFMPFSGPPIKKPTSQI